MISKHPSNYRSRLSRSLFVLGLLFYLVKGQSSLYASSDCSGDPIATTAELVVSSTPDYGFHFPPSTPASGTAFALSVSDFHSGHACLSAHYDNYARLVLKSSEYAFICQPRSSLFRKIRTFQHQSSDADPLLFQV
jgi:hypothetical protein